MGFHRLVVPTYAGGLRGGDDYINNAVAGTPAPADTVLGGGTYIGSYFFIDGQVTAAGVNRGLKALAANCDFLDDKTVQMVLDYVAADAVVTAAFQAADTTITTNYQAADTALANDYNAQIAAEVNTRANADATEATNRTNADNLRVLISDDRRVRSINLNKVIDDGGFADKTVIFTAAGITLTLPDPSVSTGRSFWLIDRTGTLNPTTPTTVTLIRFGTEKIEEVAASYALSVPYGRWRLTTDGTDWFLFSC